MPDGTGSPEIGGTESRPEKGNSTPIEVTTSGGTLTPKEQVQDLLAKHSDTVAKAVPEFFNLRTIKDEELKKETEKLRKLLAEIIQQIKDPARSSEFDFLPPEIKAVLASLEPDKITPENSPILYVTLQESFNKKLDNKSTVLRIATRLNALRNLDTKVSKQLLDPIKGKMEELSIEGETYDAIEGFLQDEIPIDRLNSKTKDPRLKALKKDLEIRRSLREYPIPDDMLMKKLYADGTIAAIKYSAKEAGHDDQWVYQQTAEAIEVERHTIRREMEMRYDNIFSGAQPDDPEDLTDEQIRELRRSEFVEYMRDMVQKGYFEQDKFLEIRKDIKKVYKIFDEIDTERPDGGMSLLEHERQRAGITEWSSKETETLFNAMGSADNFLTYIKTKYVPPFGVDYDPEDPGAKDFDNFNWEQFSRDMKNIFEDVLSRAETNPLAFFQEAFSDFYEGHFYRVLTIQLGALARAISSDSDLGGKTVPITGITSMEDRGQRGRRRTVEGRAEGEVPDREKPMLHAKEQLSHEGKLNPELSDAVGFHLVNRMVTLKNLTESLHNTEAIVELGLKWETLAEQAERINLKDMDLLFRDEKELTDAYNLYHSALKSELGLSRHIAPTSFGNRDEVTQLDFAQSSVYRELLARHAPDPGQAEVSQTVKNRVRRLTRMASSISKGVTGQYWGTLLSARMPMSFEEKWVPVFDEHGNPVPELNSRGKPKMEIARDEDGKALKDDKGKIIYKEVQKKEYERTTTKLTFNSMHASGFERMLGQLDLDLTLERFGVPDIFHAMRYAYAPRNFKKFKGAYSRDEFNGMFHHGVIYDIRDAIQESYFTGRNELLERFDPNNVTFSEFLKANSVDMMFRGGWRFNQIKAYVKYNGNPELSSSTVNLQGSLEEIKKKGSHALMAFFDSDDVWSRLPSETRNRFANDHERFRKEMYQKYIFERISKISLSQWIGLEMPRYTPQNEGFIDDAMSEWLRSQGEFEDLPMEYIHNHVMKLFVTSVQLTEKNAWRKHNREAALGDEYFNESDFDESRTELERYFNLSRKSLVKFTDAQGTNYNLDGLTDEQYFGLLKKFWRHLNGEVNRTDRSRLTDPGNRRSHDRTPEKLEERYAGFLVGNIGTLKYLIGGNDFDFSDFLLSQAGRRVPARATNEANVIATQMNPEFSKLIQDAIPALVLSGVQGGPAMQEKLVELLKPVKAVSDAYGRNVDPMEGRRIAVRMGIFLERMLGKDRIYRVKGLGTVVEALTRERHGSQSSLASDVHTHHIARPTTSLDGEDLMTMGRLIAEMCQVPWTQKDISKEGYRDIQTLSARILRRVSGGAINLRKPVQKIKKKAPNDGPVANFLRKYSGGRINLTKPVYESEHDVHMGMFMKAVGANNFSRNLESRIPIGGLIIALLIYMQFRAAYKEQEK